MEKGNFEFRSWPVYREATEVTRECFQLCGMLPRDGMRATADQLRRASQSIALNIAEGSARFSRADKVNFLRVARGSVFECAAIMDILRVLQLDVETRLASIDAKLILIGKMLSGFIRFIESEKPEKREG